MDYLLWTLSTYLKSPNHGFCNKLEELSKISVQNHYQILTPNFQIDDNKENQQKYKKHKYLWR